MKKRRRRRQRNSKRGVSESEGDDDDDDSSSEDGRDEPLSPFVGRGTIFADVESGDIFFYLKREVGLKHVALLYQLFRKVEESMAKKCAAAAVRRSEQPRRVTLHINSSGGCLTSALAAYDYLRGNTRPFDVSIEGECGSAATFIALAGRGKRTISTGSTVQLHQLRFGVTGKYVDIRDCAHNTAFEMGRMHSIYKLHTTMSNEEIDEMLKTERMLTPHEAEKYGFATLVNVDKDYVVPATREPSNTFSSPPSAAKNSKRANYTNTA